MLHLHRGLPTKTSELAVVRMLLAFGLACVDTVWSLYMNSLGLSDSAIGFISASLVVVSLFTALVATPVLERFRQNKVLFYSLLVSIISFVLIAVFNNVYLFVFLAGVLTVLAVFRISCLDMVFRDTVSNRDLNKAEGFLYTLANVGWLVGPLIAGFFLIRYGLSFVFFVAAFFFLMGLVIFSLLHLRNKHHKRVHVNIVHNIGKFARNKKLHLPFFLALGLRVWWGLIYIYVPLFIIRNGLGGGVVGIFFGVLVVPLVLLEYKVGELSSKFGFRPFYIVGFGSLALLSLILFFTQNIYLQLMILCVASFFVALIEPLQDTMFFKFVNKKEEERFYPIFKSARNIGGFLGKLAIALVLLFLPSRFAYLVVAVFMIGFTVLSFRISGSLK